MNALEPIVIVGAAGQLGSDLLRAFEGRRVFAPARHDVELTDPSSLIAMMRRYRPALVINAAAYHNVDACEMHPERAFAVNAIAVDVLAGLCALSGAAFAHVSTDYVFDGTLGRPYREDDAANPLSVYGASKLAGEHLVRRHGERHFIVRTSGLYGRAGSSTKGYTFIERVIGQAQRGEPVRVVDDVTFSPSYSADVADVMRRLVERQAFGTYHVTNTGACTWYEFARSVFDALGVRADLEPIAASSLATFAKRPRYTPLDHAAVRAAGVLDAPAWRDGMIAYLGERATAGVA